MSMHSTSLNLLTRNGGICATFTPALTSTQYDQLLQEIQRDGDTRTELAELLRILAASWDVGLMIDPC